jgi:hypothetical protein
MPVRSVKTQYVQVRQGEARRSMDAGKARIESRGHAFEDDGGKYAWKVLSQTLALRRVLSCGEVADKYSSKSMTA